LLPLGTLRTGAIVAGLFLGVVLGAGAGGAAPLVAQAWQGVRFGVSDPVLGNDLGLYLVQLPLWESTLGFASHLVWAALAGAALCHFVVGGMRFTRSGAAMTESARLQLGLLVAALLLLSAMHEGLAPLRVVAGLEGSALAALAPAARWSIAVAWGVAAFLVACWAVRPWPPFILFGLGLWLGTGLLSHVMPPTVSSRSPLPDSLARPVAARATGLDYLAEIHAIPTLDPGGRPGPGAWGPDPVARLLEGEGARALVATPAYLGHLGEVIPVWLAVRERATGPELVAILEDRLGPGGTPLSLREGDPAEYPGIVSWRSLPALAVRPLRGDTVAAAGEGGIPLGGFGRRLLLAWGTQSASALGGAGEARALWWRMAPRERMARLFPLAWWDEARPTLLEGRLVWVVDGWLTAEGAALAPAIHWEGGARRYARRGFLGVIDGVTGRSDIYLRPDADSLAQSWARVAGGAILPADSIPFLLRQDRPSERVAAVQGEAVQRGPFGFIPPPPGIGSEPPPRPVLVWTTGGPAYQVPLGDLSAGGSFTGRLDGLSIASVEGPELIRWPTGSGPLRPRALASFWRRFASFEQLEDSILGAGGRLLEGPVRYEVGPPGTLAVQPLWAISANGAPTMAWMNLARGEKLGAARTPATALANLRGESAPVVPSPDDAEPLTEARRWAMRADSALRAGDLQGFGRAFEALKRVLGTP
jgi:hypothetical protein